MEKCDITNAVDESDIQLIAVGPENKLDDYRQAMSIADQLASETLGEFMLLSWYDRDRDFESPQHSSECHADSAIPGYVDYGINHGAKLKVDIEQGRFVFYYLPL
jgi:hypothetical protein